MGFSWVSLAIYSPAKQTQLSQKANKYKSYLNCNHFAEWGRQHMGLSRFVSVDNSLEWDFVILFILIFLLDQLTACLNTLHWRWANINLQTLTAIAPLAQTWNFCVVARVAGLWLCIRIAHAAKSIAVHRQIKMNFDMRITCRRCWRVARPFASSRCTHSRFKLHLRHQQLFVCIRFALPNIGFRA